jgi:thiol-disulfide isomerase/thioredoxin
MDRLPAVISAVVAAVALVAAACDSKSDPGAPPPRTNGAKVSATQGATTDAFCDVHAADDRGPAFHWPELAAGSTAPGAPAGWRWVNVWATWCKPCIAEMPRLTRWRDKLVAAGRRIELTFISVDDSDDEIAAFRRDHPDAPASIRVAGADQRAAWLKALKLNDGAIPIHLFVSPANRLRCARAGEVREQEFGVVDKLLAE